MTVPPPPTSPDPDDRPEEDADLVAYLDGEAEPEEAKRVADAMAKDPALRSKAEAYRKTYDLLDCLPRPDPSPTFTTRTLTRIGVATAPTAPTPTSVAPRPLRTGPWVLATVLLVALGFMGHRVIRSYYQAPGEPDLADKPVIDRLLLYAGVDDLGFARQLDSPDLFGEDWEGLLPVTEPPTGFATGPWTDRVALFRSYPPARRDALRTLHRDLSALPRTEQDRVIRVLESYAGWLSRLPEKARKEVLDAPSAETRLATVRQVKIRQWEESLPAPQREKLNLTANADERIRLVKEWRDKERDRQLEWQLAARQWATITENKTPWPFSDERLAKDVDAYVKAVFKPDAAPGSQRLTPVEVAKLKALQAATGQNAAWLPYGAFVLQLAEKYPTLPAPVHSPTVLDLDQLSPRAMSELRIKGVALKQRYRSVAGRWPEFALAVARDLKDPRPAAGDVPLGPCQPGDFAPPVNDFLANELLPKLSAAESRRLDQQKGKWPDYPRVMIELAKSKDLSVPGVMLPGKPSLWAKYYRYTPTREDGVAGK